MSVDGRLKVVLCWHMHQPPYADVAYGEYQQPWTYLHVMKDYVDMVALLEDAPDARVVVNFSPVLLEQFADYASQLRRHLDSGEPVRDPLLAALAADELPRDAGTRAALVRACLRANKANLIDHHPSYRALADIAAILKNLPELGDYLADQYLHDLLVWYHLAWLGETVRRTDLRVRRLMDQGRGYSAADRRQLLEIIAGLVQNVTGRYRRLAEQGRIELAMNPYAHPIVPLLLDIGAAREAMPGVTLPELSAYPGGAERARWHLDQGKAVFAKHFGTEPVGCWPSEGSLSTETLALLQASGFRWAASGETVLRNSLTQAGRAHEIDQVNALHRAHRVDDSNVSCFFRDDGLSDLIGFTYADWHGDDAVGDFVQHLENIREACTDRENCIVSVILDGENAWEYYPNNGYYFLSALYEKLSSHPGLEMTTFSRCIERGVDHGKLPELVAGSWVYGTFSTWIGDRDKNLGWEYLADAKRAFDAAVLSGKLRGEALEAATRQLAYCEASDWFWWFGDYNPDETVSDFEALYRLHLRVLYELIGQPAPDYLARVMARGAGSPEHGGTMRHGKRESEQ